DRFEGPVNVAGRPGRQRDFAAAPGRALGRPAIMWAPGVVLRGMLGEMADELVLGGQRMVAARLEEAGVTLAHPEIEPALHAVLAGGAGARRPARPRAPGGRPPAARR